MYNCSRFTYSTHRPDFKVLVLWHQVESIAVKFELIVVKFELIFVINWSWVAIFLFFCLATMPSLKTKSLNSAVVGVKTDATTVWNAIRKYGVRGRDLKCALDDLRKYEENNGYKLFSTIDSKSLDWWVASHYNIKIDSGMSYIEHELQQTAYVFF